MAANYSLKKQPKRSNNNKKNLDRDDLNYIITLQDAEEDLSHELENANAQHYSGKKQKQKSQPTKY